MNKSLGSPPDVERPSNRVRLTTTIWAITLGILFGGAILAKIVPLVGDAQEVAVQQGPVVVPNAIDTLAPGNPIKPDSDPVDVYRNRLEQTTTEAEQRADLTSRNADRATGPSVSSACSGVWSAQDSIGVMFGTCAPFTMAWAGSQHWLGVLPQPAEYASLGVVFVAGFVSAIAGFAFSAIAGGGFAHFNVDPVSALQIMVLCSFFIQLYSVIAIRRDIRWRSVLPFVAGGFTTLPLGTFLLTHISIPLFDFVLGVFLVAYGLKGLAGPIRKSVNANWKLDFVVGALGGITGGIAAFPGAFVTIWCTMRGWDKVTARAVFQPYILVMQFATIAWLRAEAVPFVEAGTAVACVAVALLAAHLGLAVFRRLGNAQFARIVAALLAISGAALLARAL